MRSFTLPPGLKYSCFSGFFFFNDTATTEIYTLSLHDALPIFLAGVTADMRMTREETFGPVAAIARFATEEDRKSTRLNSSHVAISYAVFCLKKKTPPPRPRTSTQPQRTHSR